jgi:hypothetical protein
MIAKELAAIFALSAYEDGVIDENLPTVAAPWEALPVGAVTDGFYYLVFRNTVTNEIVISYRGTDGPEGFKGYDGLNNLGLSVGVPTSQIRPAASVYAAVLQQYGVDAAGSNISFTGHSLGGGLAQPEKLNRRLNRQCRSSLVQVSTVQHSHARMSRRSCISTSNSRKILPSAVRESQRSIVLSSKHTANEGLTER